VGADIEKCSTVKAFASWLQPRSGLEITNHYLRIYNPSVNQSQHYQFMRLKFKIFFLDVRKYFSGLNKLILLNGLQNCRYGFDFANVEKISLKVVENMKSAVI
jgi:hypothetical protein